MPKITNNNPDCFSVVWELTTVCNYQCWYCDEKWYNGKYRWPDLKKSQDFFNQLAAQHKSIFLTISGGEPTLWPDLMKFIKEKPDNVYIDICTNGSRSLLWWKKVSNYLQTVCISFHPDTTDPDHVLEVIKILIDSPVKHINVWLLASKPSIDKCYYLYDKIIELNLPINASPKSLYNMEMSKPQKLIDENNNSVLDFINKPKISQSKFNIAEIKSTELFLDDHLVNLPMMVATKQNTFKGWYCTIGLKRLSIAPNGDIQKGSCGVGGVIGNIFDNQSLLLPTEPQMCNKMFCNCIDEIRLEKWKD